MKLTLLTQEEALNNDRKLLVDGIYNFVIQSAQNRTSKKGNEMIAVILKVWGNDGKEYTVYDYLLNMMKYKIKHFCDATELTEKYNSGELDANDCIGKSGKVKLTIQKDETGQYPDKNAVVDYIVSTESKKLPRESMPFDDDDVPF